MKRLTHKCKECRITKFRTDFKTRGISKLGHAETCKECSKPKGVQERKEQKRLMLRAVATKCSKCGVIKFRGEFTVHSTTNQIQYTCKPCVSARVSDYYVKNPDKVKQYQESYRNNPDNKEKIQKRKKKYTVENSEKLKAKSKAYLEKNKEVMYAKAKLKRQENKDKLREEKRLYREQNLELVKARDKVWRHSPCKSENLFERLPPDAEGQLNSEGFIEVKCKLCGKHLTPTNSQVQARLRAFAGKQTGEHHFYCSEDCRNACPLFGYHPQYHDPRLPKPNVDPRSCQTDNLKQLQCDEKGYNYCEKCGDIVDVDLHHTLPVAQYQEEAINSAGHILLCPGCHIELHRECA